MDHKARRQIWDGKVGLVFKLASNEITSMEPPLPFMMMVSRMSYLPLVSEVREHFFEHVCAREDEMWFDYRNTPLRWDIPVGVLYDLVNTNRPAPLRVTVHFLGFPSKQLLRCPNTFTVRSHFTNSLKQACFLQYATASVANNLDQTDHEDLWNAIEKNDQRGHEDVINRLQENAGERNYWPVRLYLNHFEDEFEHDLRCISRPLSTGNKAMTLQDALHELVPGVVSDLQNKELRKDVKVIIHGIEPPMDTPLQWLWETCSHPDCFLYIAIVKT